MGQVGPVNGMMTMGANKPQSTPVSSTTSKSAKEYDFSSLTQGMFAKQWLVCSTLLAVM
jgi:stromal membrane-associated protein